MWAMSVDGFFALVVHLYSQWRLGLATSAAHCHSLWDFSWTAGTAATAATGVQSGADETAASAVPPKPTRAPPAMAIAAMVPAICFFICVCALSLGGVGQTEENGGSHVHTSGYEVVHWYELYQVSIDSLL